MLVTIGTTIAAAGLAGFSFFKTHGPATNDTEKIQKIFNQSGWAGKEGETIRIHRKRKIDGGMEYVFQLPLGFDRKEIEKKKHVLEDGLNVRTKYLEFDKSDLLKIKWDKTALEQIKKILTNTKVSRKEIDLDFDGMLRIKVYNAPFPTLINWQDSMLKPGSWAVIIGHNRQGPIYHDFDDKKHLIIAGATGGGKSVVMKCIISSLILQKPDHVEFSLIDLKGGPAFARFKNCKQVVNFGTNNKEALKILKDVQTRMEAEYEKIVFGGHEDVKEAGIKKRHFIVIDEAADLAGNVAAMEILTDIVRKGRGAGYYVIYATQYPSAQAIPMQIKRNVPARLCFVLDSSSASMTVLDQPGAEDLPELPGRGIYKGGAKQCIMQAPLMPNKEIETRIKPHIIMKTQGEKEDGQKAGKTTENRKHPIIITKI